MNEEHVLCKRSLKVRGLFCIRNISMIMRSNHRLINIINIEIKIINVILSVTINMLSY